MCAAVARRLVGCLVAAVVASQLVAQPVLPEIDLQHFLPVASPTLSVGTFQPIRRSTGVTRPFFLVGTDQVSLRWLERHRNQLIELQAVGLVVEASNPSDYRALEQVAVGLAIRPVSGDVLAEHLNLHFYPALVTAEGIFP